MIFRLYLFIFFALIPFPLKGNCQLANAQGEPSEALLILLNTYGICHDGSWLSIQEATEQAWLSHGRNTNLWEIDPKYSPQTKRK